MTKQIRALARGLAIVNAIDSAEAPPTLGELHHVTGIDRATILRILATLEAAGWVYRGIGDNRYRLTYKLHEIGDRVSIHDAIAQLASPVIDRLQKEIQWPSDISVYNGRSMEIVETTRKRTPFVMNREAIGYSPSMLQSAMGRAYLAFSDERQRQLILRRLQEGGGEDARLAKDVESIELLLREIRERGFATRDPNTSILYVDFDGSFSAIAVPILVKGDVQACLNVVWITEAYADPGTENLFFEKLKPAAEELSELFLENRIY
ncbi:helix-turn-helix domain-containing protein [Halomonas sp. M5N1S17]|uniref:helix-turn-helix domain-containing protein n=1 Tax=Halomonas alkalisoli TaxID=2907158 RepID=UPI001F2965B4|nr:helix-turn-helix domain-containing protein [Halomonas alkalisoli]MCE9664691.1 helix-turn-helix domain-containing protein [Halomonas alkalisoli]